MPVIQDLRTRADALRRRELERALKQLARGEAPEAVIEQLSQALTNKFLHDPMSTLREAGDDAEQAAPAGAARALLLELRRLAAARRRRGPRAGAAAGDHDLLRAQAGLGTQSGSATRPSSDTTDFLPP